MYPTLTIANYVILIGISRKRYVNADKLNKILYFLDACHLYETNGTALFEETFKRWEDGPVLYSLMIHFRENPSEAIMHPIDRDQYDPQVIDPEIREMIRHVYDNIGNYSVKQLKQMILSEDIFEKYSSQIISKTAPDITAGEMYQYFNSHSVDRIWED